MNIRHKHGAGFGWAIVAVGAIAILPLVMLGLLARQWIDARGVERLVADGRAAPLAGMLLAILATLAAAVALARSIERRMKGRERAIDELNRESAVLRASQGLLQAIIDDVTAASLGQELRVGEQARELHGKETSSGTRCRSTRTSC